MKKILIIIGIILTITLSSCFKSSDEFIETYDSIENVMKTHIGDTLILVNDTLIVVEYSVWNSNYTLHNGTKVNNILIEK